MSEGISLESTDAVDAIDSKIKGILNPTLHHHDLLQSYVRATAEGASSSKHPEETENLNKNPSSLDTCLGTESFEDVDKESRASPEGRRKRSDKKQPKERSSDKLSVESEMNIQKKKR
ncbi:uncharacterized protein LOC143368709 [Andrena cerasifolii]|uniref:uncharacterized protein LOC143368709 n=1 Tax=Andrena cerasifolii TaxID=2819439 RepID=UPI004037D120